MTLLEQIHSPKQLKELSVQELPVLAQEIREFLIRSLSVTGGHLASNLGVVELTIAMHYLFDSPKDKFLWDVGHQSYVHKLLTGRQEFFPTLRQYKGLCGFPKMNESKHDVWETGHSSTSLSGAMGMATARDLQKKDFKVIPIIGDGALTGGMALEALNHIGQEKKDMIVILNDNEMSISPNVGALHNHLGRLRTNKSYHRFKVELQQLLEKIPCIGISFSKALERIKDSFKFLVVSDGVLFETMGFTYLGPIDGHCLDELMDGLRQSAKIKGPILLHVVTKKGQGYKPAEEDSVNYHGVGTYKIESGQVKKTSGVPTYPEVFGETMLRLAAQNQDIVVVTPAMLTGAKLEKFSKVFPERCFDVGIAEQHAVTFAAGLSTQGLKPVVSIYSTFLQRGYDQFIHDVCKQRCNVVFAIDRAGFVGEDGETHQGIYDISFMRNQPHIVIMMPRDENEFQHMLYSAIQYNEGPIAVRYSKCTGTGASLDPAFQKIPIGKAEIVRSGDDIILFAFGTMVEIAMVVAERLVDKGISVRVINARFVKPLDEELLLAISRERLPIITLEEGSSIGGLGSAVLEFYEQQEIYDMTIKVLGIPDYYVEHGTVLQQRAEVGLVPEKIIDEVTRLLLKNNSTSTKARS